MQETGYFTFNNKGKTLPWQHCVEYPVSVVTILYCLIIYIFLFREDNPYALGTLAELWTSHWNIVFRRHFCEIKDFSLAWANLAIWLFAKTGPDSMCKWVISTLITLPVLCQSIGTGGLHCVFLYISLLADDHQAVPYISVYFYYCYHCSLCYHYYCNYYYCKVNNNDDSMEIKQIPDDSRNRIKRH